MALIDNLLVTEEAFGTAIATFENKKTALENAYLKVSNEVRELSNSYKGEAANAFQSNFEQLYSNIKTTETSMQGVIDTLKSVQGIYEKYEESIKALISQLEEGMGYIRM